MTLTQQAILAMVQRDALALANELADKTDFEAAGILLRITQIVGDVPTDAGIATVVRSLLDDALQESGFTWAKQRIRAFRETFDYGVQQIGASS